MPLLAAIRPNGDGLIEEFEAAGGARAVMKHLEPLLATCDARSITGRRWRSPRTSTTVKEDGVIPSLEHAALDGALDRHRARLLLPGGGIVRLGGAGARMMSFRGPANIFHSRDEALEAIKPAMRSSPARWSCCAASACAAVPGMAHDLGRGVRARRRRPHRPVA